MLGAVAVLAAAVEVTVLVTTNCPRWRPLTIWVLVSSESPTVTVTWRGAVAELNVNAGMLLTAPVRPPTRDDEAKAVPRVELAKPAPFAPENPLELAEGDDELLAPVAPV
jgi:hypothetical protein